MRLAAGGSCCTSAVVSALCEQSWDGGGRVHSFWILSGRWSLNREVRRSVLPGDEGRVSGAAAAGLSGDGAAVCGSEEDGPRGRRLSLARVVAAMAPAVTVGAGQGGIVGGGPWRGGVS